MLSSLAATLVAARDCPTESACIQTACSDFHITDQVKGLWGTVERVLGATCKDRHGTEVFTWLSLDHCITNSHGTMYWSYMGSFRCEDCKVLPRNDNEAVILECKCNDNDNRGTINLSEGIWQYNGRIGCYKDEGGLVPIEPIKKKRSNEPQSFSLPWPVGQTLDDVPRSVGQRAVSLPFPVGQTADKIPHPVEHLSDGSTHGPPTLPRDAEMPSERRSEEPSAVKFTRDENTPFGDDDSTEEPAFDDGNGKRSEESHAEYISKRGRSFRQF
ncbi:cvnh domain-containing protein [Colletotrichum kahawae]|uniref:Cvnh domain-containing protein n=1 Tax=Colletotrichum kahawae TaxID=34407 RepID=A0AAD9YMF1_COLKA|nr:cvnh domain-containing protein [Colletotrichum kahawae]